MWKSCVLVPFLHTVCHASAQTSPIKSAPPSSSSHVSSVVLFSPRLETGKSLFLTGGVYPQPCKVKIKKINKSEFIFSVLAPSLQKPVSKNVFLLVQQPQCASLCVNVYIYIYVYVCITVHVWIKEIRLFLCAGAFSVHVISHVNGFSLL